MFGRSDYRADLLFWGSSALPNLSFTPFFLGMENLFYLLKFRK